MLFIDNDHPQTRQRRENRQSRTENDRGLAAESGTPVALTGSIGQFAVQRDDAGLGETPAYAFLELRRQVDFRYQ